MFKNLTTLEDVGKEVALLGGESFVARWLLKSLLREATGRVELIPISIQPPKTCCRKFGLPVFPSTKTPLVLSGNLEYSR